jgi:hypothetical protein
VAQSAKRHEASFSPQPMAGLPQNTRQGTGEATT